ncbi:MAG: hypothetical protein J3K34DRAFT_445767 [Monoraphidium minutum]|nr:MAG: hypothetical protein J3K34DRAFT_445767 [Monoraphidium minutum]
MMQVAKMRVLGGTALALCLRVAALPAPCATVAAARPLASLLSSVLAPHVLNSWARATSPRQCVTPVPRRARGDGHGWGPSGA